MRYIPKYERDLNEILDYIVFNLNNPDSAMKLVDKIENAILQRLCCPLSFEQFQSKRNRKNSYYRIYVDNFTEYYVVIDDVIIDDVMEVRPILYKGRDAGSIIR